MRHLYGHARRVYNQDRDGYRRDIARNIKTLRLEREIAVSELAAATGINESSLYKIERGEKSPYVDTIIRIALALGVMPSELMP